MSEGKNPTYDKWLKDALAEELATRDELLPPWLKHPEIPRASIGWRMGYGETYMWTWDGWAEQLEQGWLVEYFKRYAPIPVEWLDWVASRLGRSVLDDMLAGGGEFAGIHWLEEHGLASFTEFKTWYDQYWSRRVSQDRGAGSAG